jgi:hypothetical protein
MLISSAAATLASMILSLVKNSQSPLILAFVYLQLTSQERKRKQQEEHCDVSPLTKNG